jgi:4-amino-4-deoxy-L-arabinose transferase-like glycosyltransferase
MRRPFVAAAAIVALAAILRITWVLLVPTRPVGDFAMYLESAAYLLEHGALDPEFVYMPGYVLMAAGVMALGGGLLAIKIVLGALLSALGAGAIYGIVAVLWGRPEALAAGLACALWPAGIAVSSVTGTDMPAAILILLAVWALVRWARTRPRWAAVGFGVGMGLAAYVRAVAVPLAALSVLHFRATGASWRQAVTRAGTSALIAFLVLSPWVVRNRLRYGEWFLTDSHGGLTALVGANPNTDGRYSRSLNRLFKEVTGYTLLAEPHRQADRAAYALAREMSAVSPAYAAGLVALKAERLLDIERPLLYWPLYRAGVLRDGPVRRWFDTHRPGLETLTDAFWIALAIATFAGLGLAAARRRWDILALVPIQLALVGVYALYFAEPRYQLPIVVLMFPIAAGVMQIRRSRRELVAMITGVAVLLAGWPAVKALGEHLRERHRFAAHVCRIDGQPRMCLWTPASGGLSPVRGVYDGLGLALDRGDPTGRAAARTHLSLAAGPHLLRARFDLTPSSTTTGDLEGCRISLAGTPVSIADLVAATAQGHALAVETSVLPDGKEATVELEAVCPPDRHRTAALWLSDLELARTPQSPSTRWP